MSILEMIPPDEFAEVVKSAANDDHADTTPNGLALRWCVAKLARYENASQKQAESLQLAALEQMRTEVERLQGVVKMTNEANAKADALVREKNRALKFALDRLVVYTTLAERLADWDRHYGTADQQDPALQLALHDARKKLDAIAAEEQKF